MRLRSIINLTFARSRRLRQEFLWIICGQILLASGAILGVRLLTGVLTPASYGELALGMTIVTLAYNVALWPVGWVSTRFFAPAQEANQIHEYLRAIVYLLAWISVIVIIVIGSASFILWILDLAEWSVLLLIILIFVLLSGYNITLDSIQNAARQRAIVALHQGVGQWLRFLTAVALIILLGASSQVAMLGYALASLLVLGSQLVFFQRRILTNINPQSSVTQENINSWIEQMKTYGWPFVTWGPFTWAQLSSDRWALQTFRTTSDVGLYAVLYQLGFYPIHLFFDAMVQLVSPLLFSRAGDGSDTQRVQQARRWNYLLVLFSVLLAIMGTFLAFLLHDWIFSLLVAPDYRSVSFLLPWMVLAGGLFASGQVASVLFMTTVNTQQLIAPKIITAILGISLNFVGAYWLGLTGVVLAILIFSAIYFVWILYAAHRFNKTTGS